MKKIRVEQLPEFKSDIKKLLRKVKTLEEDLQTFINYQLNPFHLMGQNNKGIKRISDSGITETEIYKVRKFTSKSLKGKGVQSGLRIIYAYFGREGRIELVEIYFKGDKDLENRSRIRKLYG